MPNLAYWFRNDLTAMTEQSPSLPAISTLLDAISAPAVLIDSDYRICASNVAYRQTFTEGDPRLQRKCYEVSHGYKVPCDQAGETCPLRQCLESGQRQRLLHIHNTAKGREHVDVELNPIRSENGDIQYFVEIMHPASRPSEHHKAMIGFSPTYTRMLELLSRAAPADISVLLLGESGTGKELAAHYLHSNSDRADKPFVTVECSGLTESLFESELFGHEKGAFTGAIHRKEGLVEAARGGTLFLDEVGDIPLTMQVKLLRLIESGSYRPVGSVNPKQADFRLICATHRQLPQLVEQGKFRQDLYYRISPFPVILPSLRERQQDILPLAQHLLHNLTSNRGLTFSAEAQQWLQQQRFPGNIRELRNLIERSVLLCDTDEIGVAQLQPDMGAFSEQPAAEMIEFSQAQQSDQIIPLDQVEQHYLARIAARFDGDNATLASKLQISERTLYRKLKAIKQN